MPPIASEGKPEGSWEEPKTVHTVAWGTLPFPLPCTPSLEDSHEGWLGEADTATLPSELLSSALPGLPPPHGYWLLSYLRSLNLNVHVKPPTYHPWPFNTKLTLEHQVDQSHGSQSTHPGPYLPQGYGALHSPVQPSRLGIWDGTLKSRSLEEAAYRMMSHRGGGRIWS